MSDPNAPGGISVPEWVALGGMVVGVATNFAVAKYRLDNMEKSTEKHSSEDKKLEEKMAAEMKDLSDRVVRLEGARDGLKEDIERIEKTLDNRLGAMEQMLRELLAK